MTTTANNDILFDDAALLQTRFGKHYLKETAENISPDCNCSGYTAIEENEAFSPIIAHNDADNFHDCTNNLILI